eukprot:846738-Alexandrium_andersonii.AAC.1
MPAKSSAGASAARPSCTGRANGAIGTRRLAGACCNDGGVCKAAASFSAKSPAIGSAGAGGGGGG